jgi:hypothetical protein
MTNSKHSAQQLLSYRLSPFSRARETLKTEQAAEQDRSGRTIEVSEEMLQEFLEENGISEGVCVNHPTKRAAFE